MAFGDRFNHWLVAKGKEPVSDAMVASLNDAAKQVATEMRVNQDLIGSELQRLGADLSNGVPVDIEARVGALMEKMNARQAEADRV